MSYGGKSFRFDPGALCMELVTTGGPGEFARYEVLHEPADLVRWVERSRLPGGLEVTVTEGELAQTRALRDAVFLLAADRAHGRPLQARHLDVVNAGAAGAPLAARVEADGSRGWAPGATGARLLATVARDAVELFTGPYADRIRECGSHNCASALRRHLAARAAALVRHGTLRQPPEGAYASGPGGRGGGWLRGFLRPRRPYPFPSLFWGLRPQTPASA